MQESAKDETLCSDSNITCLRALAKASIATASLPAVFAARSETALAINISEQPAKQNETVIIIYWALHGYIFNLTNL